ncbi:MAG: ABC transporter ATP-binding protein/permease [Jaaginema sp. PMC 1079.18]|nr:ABC transporter ATP-binding protein/permease [Jaaginema sp. PMC 1080.18]MEC4851771.1 ABC transporter ATP-binding protein/permease [Jaaginema sp. PMC 1079.18]MEC4864519.1 ABC transporter ATP-binding protein/permease [Jaaginema sp. PMC 1078.18]
MALIEVKQVSKSFSEGLFKQRTVLKDINLIINPGNFVVLRGANGAGKSTLLKIILGLQEPDAGEVKLFGKSPKSPASKLQVGTVFQEVTPPDQLTVREVLDLVRSYYPDTASTQESLEKFGLIDKQNAFPSNLAGGQKQRLYFAIALIGKPKLLVLDEPTKNLDLEGQEAFWQEIAKCRDEGVTILMVTHVRSEQDELQNLATHIITVADAKLTFDKQPDKSDNLSNLNFEECDSANILKILGQQTWAEALQLYRKPLYLIGALLLSGGLATILPSSIRNQTQLLPILVYVSAITFILFSVDRLGKQIALERVEGWLKLVKVTPLPPGIYILAKLLIAIFILLLNFVTIFGIGIFTFHLEISFLAVLQVAGALLLGVIPFALLGIALGYIIPPKSVDSIAGLVLVIGLFSAGAMPIKIEQLSFLQNFFVISPFFHYQKIIDFVAHSEDNNRLILHILWLFFYSIAASAIAQYAYQRDRLSQ